MAPGTAYLLQSEFVSDIQNIHRTGKIYLLIWLPRRMRFLTGATEMYNN